jgi:tRNA (cmo5U34)-methyltransferase
MPKSDNTTPHLALFYDNQIMNTIPYYDCFHLETINLIKARKNLPQFWLDTGCGTGSLIQKAVDAFPETTFLMADPSSEMIQIAKEKLNANHRVRFLELLATHDLQLELKVDIVTAIQAHHYLSKEIRKQATQVCFDVLAEKGIYITFENIRLFPTKELRSAKRIGHITNYPRAKIRNRFNTISNALIPSTFR